MRRRRVRFKFVSQRHSDIDCWETKAGIILVINVSQPLLGQIPDRAPECHPAVNVYFLFASLESYSSLPCSLLV